MAALSIVLVALIALFVLAWSLLRVAERRFRANALRDVVSLLASERPLGPRDLEARRAALPAPIRRMLDYSLGATPRTITNVHLTHDGFFRTSENASWSRIRGDEWFTVADPGFVWMAEVNAAPLVWIAARDELVEGRGGMLVKLFSVFRIADARGPELDQGARMRWLAVLVWFPIAAVSDRIRWDSIDARAAVATVLADGLPVRLVFEVDDEGRCRRVHGRRYREVGGRSVATRWTAICDAYRDVEGMRVPTSIEAMWNLDAGDVSYAEFHLTSLELNAEAPSTPAPLGEARPHPAV